MLVHNIRIFPIFLVDVSSFPDSLRLSDQCLSFGIYNRSLDECMVMVMINFDLL